MVVSVVVKKSVREPQRFLATAMHQKEDDKHGKNDFFNPEYFLRPLRDVD